MIVASQMTIIMFGPFDQTLNTLLARLWTVMNDVFCLVGPVALMLTRCNHSQKGKRSRDRRP